MSKYIIRNSITKILPKIALVSIVIGAIYQIYLEHSHKSDSIGILYTLYGSIIYALIISAILLIVYIICLLMMGRRQ